MKQVRATARITGVVQGVNFRYFTMRQARAFNLTGWVRNLPGGDVEALFEGRESDVRQVMDACRKGPAGASVAEMMIDWEPFRGEFDSFEIRR